MKSDWEMTVDDLDFDDSLSGRIIECFIRVHNELGSGLYESIYKRSLLVDFEAVGLAYECEKYIDVFYRGVNVGVQRLDLLVEQQIIVELKVVEQLSKAHYAQLRSYLRAARLEVGLLVNFANEKVDFRRVTVTKHRPDR